MRHLIQHALAFAQGLTHQTDLSILQIAQSAMDNSGGAAGSAGRKIVLLNQYRAFAPLRALTRNGNTVNAAADYQNVKVPITGLNWATHAYIYLDAF